MSLKKERYKKTLLDLANSGRFIPGIYNYCDQWCERCTMTNKCLTFAHKKELNKDIDPETNDINNENFWEQIRLSFEAAMEMLHEKAKDLGIDLDKPEKVERPVHIDSPLEDLAKNFGYKMHDWLKTNQEALADKANQILLLKNKEIAQKFTDALEVVKWYHFFIAAKVYRAHMNLEKRQGGDDEYGVYSDNLGSAKIAIIAAERSFEALSIIYTEMKENEDEILKFLARLSHIKKQLLTTFPGVMEFKRPGFDN